MHIQHVFWYLLNWTVVSSNSSNAYSGFKDGRARNSTFAQEEKETSWFVLSYRWEPTMVHLLIAGFPGKKSSAAFVAVYGCKAWKGSRSTEKKIRFMLTYLCLRLCHSFLAGNFQFNLRVDLHSRRYSRVASVWRRVFVRNHSYENVFSLYVHFQVN